MSQFDFRLRFNLPESHRIDSDAEELELLSSGSGQTIYLKGGRGGGPIRDQTRAAVRGGPFESEQDARNAAERSKRALLFWAIEQRAGIDFGDGRQRGIATDLGLQMLEQQIGVPVRNDIHGVDIFEHSQDVRFVHISATARVGVYPPNFAAIFEREYSKDRHASPKQVLACEIYASSFFDISQRSRFITLVTAVESLLELAERPDSAQSLVDELEIKTEQAGIDNATKASIKGSLQWLRRESISQAGRNLSNSLLPNKTYSGKPAGAFFSSCYDLRSNILHHGTAGPEVDVSGLASVVEEFVANLLLASLNATP
jgi:hypothetical protein